jgi:2-C-methyl-D-erythritol 4-phosphate cytidylyltransferase
MGAGSDKLFMEVGGLPLVAHTWARFDEVPEIDEVVLVVRDGMQKLFSELSGRCEIKKPFRVITGGAERQESVWHGLEAIQKGCEVVAIQDGARPCTPIDLIRATLEAAREFGAAVAAQKVTDTIKESEDGSFVARTLPRERLWAVQTPQTFRVEVIRRALEAVRSSGAHVTDDTAACELIGQPVKLVESELPNPKATCPSDLRYIEAVLSGMKPGSGC